LLFLTGCDAMQSARNDLARLTSSRSTPAPTRSHPPQVSSVQTASKASTAPSPPGAAEKPADSSESTGNAASSPAVNLVGKSESEIRGLLGSPSSEEDRAPGKVWRYRDGQCTVDVQFFRDVQTRQFGTLAYEVKSDDNSDEGKRVCMAQLRARTQGAR
jgi:hypothetical protein